MGFMAAPALVASIETVMVTMIETMSGWNASDAQSDGTDARILNAALTLPQTRS